MSSSLLEAFPAPQQREQPRTQSRAQSREQSRPVPPEKKAAVRERDVSFVRKTLSYKVRSRSRLTHVDRHLIKHLGQLEKGLFAPSLTAVGLQLARAFLKPSVLLGAACAGFVYFVPLEELPLETLASASSSIEESSLSEGAESQLVQQVALTDLAIALAGEEVEHFGEEGLGAVSPVALPQPLAQFERQIEPQMAPRLEPPLQAASLNRQNNEIGQQRSLVKFISGIIAAFRPSIKDSGAVARHIVELSAVENVDPIYVAAVIAIESRFSSSAQSKAGAMGLMQLMPTTAKEVANSRHHRTAHLVDPRTNIKLGISYLKQLEARYGGNRFLALAAYNWGPANVDKAKGRQSRIPASVRNYSNTVLERTTSWRKHFSKANANAEALQTVTRETDSKNS